MAGNNARQKFLFYSFLRLSRVLLCFVINFERLSAFDIIAITLALVNYVFS